MTRSKILSKISGTGWYPVVAAETMIFKQSIKLFDRFDIESSVIGWDQKAFIMRQRFLKKTTVVAEAIVRARFLKKSGGSVRPEEILKLLGISDTSPELEHGIHVWNQNQI